MGDRLGPFDIGLLPIGAYSPRSFMSSIHVSPEDAVEIHIDTRCRRSVGMHWGTMPLTDEPSTEPPARLASALQRRGLAQDVFTKLKLGGTLGRLGPLYPSHLWSIAATKADDQQLRKTAQSVRQDSTALAPGRLPASKTNSGTQRPSGQMQIVQRQTTAPPQVTTA